MTGGRRADDNGSFSLNKSGPAISLQQQASAGRLARRVKVKAILVPIVYVA
jgi:hypothetical protein